MFFCNKNEIYISVQGSIDFKDELYRVFTYTAHSDQKQPENINEILQAKVGNMFQIFCKIVLSSIAKVKFWRNSCING